MGRLRMMGDDGTEEDDRTDMGRGRSGTHIEIE